MRLLLALAFGMVLAGAAPALADPCEAIPGNGPLPAYLSYGARFAGPVVFVIDGDSFCVAVGPGHDQWVEVRAADFFAPETSQASGARAKAALERIALGKQAVCYANTRTFDRIAAQCSIGGKAVGDLMRRAGVAEGGHGLERAAARNSSASESSSDGGGFGSCAAARAAGAAPMRRGDPGYSPRLDRDGDGIACEPYRGR